MKRSNLFLFQRIVKYHEDYDYHDGVLISAQDRITANNIMVKELKDRSEDIDDFACEIIGVGMTCDNFVVIKDFFNS